MMIWDLRKRQTVYTIPAHTNLISHVKFHGKAWYYMYALSTPMDPCSATVNLVIYQTPHTVLDLKVRQKYCVVRRIFNSLLVFFSFSSFFFIIAHYLQKKHLNIRRFKLTRRSNI